MAEETKSNAEETGGKSEDHSPAASWVDIFKDTQTYVRFIAFVLLVPVFLALASILLIKELRPIKQVEFKEGGTILFLQDKQPGWAYVVVPANEVWIQTGLTIKPRQVVKIKASGSVNLGVHRLVQASETHERPPLPWMGPDGSDLSGHTESSKQSQGREMLIDRRFNQGALLGYLQHPDEPEPGAFNPRPSTSGHGIFKVGKCFALNASEEESGKLWFVVNDAFMDNDKFEQLFVSKRDPKKETELKRTQTFRQIMKDSYYEMYFNDNIGDFFVQITFDPQDRDCSE